MFSRLDLGALKELFSRDIPTPVHVPNLLQFDDFESYRWYGVFVFPLLYLVGASIRWMGTHTETFRGPLKAEEFLVVEYPNHRRFLALGFNPYYLFANLYRVKGVSRFEASFTYSPEHEVELNGHQWLVVVHFNGDEATLERVKNIFSDSDGDFVYSSYETSPVDIFETNVPSDPNPLTFKRMAFFSFPDRQSAERFVNRTVLDELEDCTERFAAHLYEEGDREDFIPDSLPVFW